MSSPEAPSPAPINVGFDAASAAALAEPKPVREIPPWLVAIVVLGCLAGAGWFIYTNWLRTGPAERIVILDRGPDDGVKPAGAGKVEVRSGIAALMVTKTGNNDADLYFKWVLPEYMTAEQQEVLRVVLRLTTDAAMAAEVKVTPEQLEQLKANRAKAKADLTDADKSRLKALFLAYDGEKEKEPKRKAESKLLKALDAVAAEMEGVAKQIAAERTANAKAILTPEQFQRFEAVGQEGKPAERPALPRRRP